LLIHGGLIKLIFKTLIYCYLDVDFNFWWQLRASIDRITRIFSKVDAIEMQIADLENQLFKIPKLKY
jgi:hypothetical protein